MGNHSSQAGHRPVLTGPASGRRLRAFELTGETGHRRRLRDCLRRTNVVIFLYHGPDCPACREYLRALAQAARQLREEDETAVLAIGPSVFTPGVPRTPAFPIPLLIDNVGATAAEEGVTVPALVVADRFGELWAAWVGGEEHQLPSLPEIRAWLDLIQLQCPE